MDLVQRTYRSSFIWLGDYKMMLGANTGSFSAPNNLYFLPTARAFFQEHDNADKLVALLISCANSEQRREKFIQMGAPAFKAYFNQETPDHLCGCVFF